MILTDREKEIMEAISSIGRRNISMKQIADYLGISHNHLRHKKMEMIRKNGYYTFMGFLCDYVKEKERSGQ